MPTITVKGTDNMPNRSTNDEVLAVLRAGEVIQNSAEFINLLDNAVFYCPFIDNGGFPTPAPIEAAGGTVVLPIFTHEDLLENAIHMNFEMWAGEVSLREAVRWMQTKRWAKIVINYRDRSYSIDKEEVINFEPNIRVA